MKHELRLWRYALETAACSAASVFVSAFALPVAISVVRIWVRLYTFGLPQEIRDRRRREMESELSEHVRDDRAAGYRPVDTALHILARCVRGAPADIWWSAAEHWTRLVAAWALLVVWAWARFILPRKLRAAPDENLGLLLLVMLLVLVLVAVNSREQPQAA
jgi:hypothetical protein